MIYGPGQQRPTSGQSPYLKFLEQNASRWQGVADQVLKPETTAASAPRTGQEANLDAAIAKGGLGQAQAGNTAAWQQYQQPSAEALRANAQNSIDAYNKSQADLQHRYLQDQNNINLNRVNLGNDYQHQLDLVKRDYDTNSAGLKNQYQASLDKNNAAQAKSQYVNALLGTNSADSGTAPLVAALNSYGAGNGPAQQINTIAGQLGQIQNLGAVSGNVAKDIADRNAIDQQNAAIYNQYGQQDVARNNKLILDTKSVQDDLMSMVNSLGYKGKLSDLGNKAQFGSGTTLGASLENNLIRKYGITRAEARQIIDSKGANAKDILSKSKRTAESPRGSGILGNIVEGAVNTGANLL